MGFSGYIVSESLAISHYQKYPHRIIQTVCRTPGQILKYITMYDIYILSCIHWTMTMFRWFCRPMFRPGNTLTYDPLVRYGSVNIPPFWWCVHVSGECPAGSYGSNGLAPCTLCASGLDSSRGSTFCTARGTSEFHLSTMVGTSCSKIRPEPYGRW